MDKKKVMVYASALMLLFFSAYLPGAVTSPRVCHIKIINADKKEIILKAEIADNDDSRSRGLMFRTSLGTDRGMLFIFDREQHLSFWMRNTKIPLSIAYISDSGLINEIYPMKPHDETPVYSRRKARYALEVNRDWFSRKSVFPGSRIIIDGCISK